MAFNQCQTGTIANVIGCDYHTLEKHFSKILTKKRAEGKARLHKNQMNQAKTIPTMAIFLGKNYLEQRDVKEQDINIPQLSKPITFEIIKKRIRQIEKSDDGIDHRSISGGKG